MTASNRLGLFHIFGGFFGALYILFAVRERAIHPALLILLVFGLSPVGLRTGGFVAWGIGTRPALLIGAIVSDLGGLWLPRPAVLGVSRLPEGPSPA